MLDNDNNDNNKTAVNYCSKDKEKNQNLKNDDSYSFPKATNQT